LFDFERFLTTSFFKRDDPIRFDLSFLLQKNLFTPNRLEPDVNKLKERGGPAHGNFEPMSESHERLLPALLEQRLGRIWKRSVKRPQSFL